MNPSQTSAEPPTSGGVRVNHPRILEGIQVLLKKGYGNQEIVKIIGVPNEVVDRERSKFEKMKH